MIFRRSKNVPRLNRYIEYRDSYLRPDFRFRCAYCLTPEFYFLHGDGGEIDHFRPLNPPKDLRVDFSHLENEYSNLYWSCSRCNLNKGNIWPTEQDLSSGFRFLDPCEEDHDDHWDIQPDGSLVARTKIGEYTIDTIRLNRHRLVALRYFLIDCAAKLRQIEELLATREITPEVRNALHSQLHILRDILEPSAVP